MFHVCNNYHNFNLPNLILSPIRFAAIEQLVFVPTSIKIISNIWSESNDHRDDTYHYHIGMCPVVINCYLLNSLSKTLPFTLPATDAVFFTLTLNVIAFFFEKQHLFLSVLLYLLQHTSTKDTDKSINQNVRSLMRPSHSFTLIARGISKSTTHDLIKLVLIQITNNNKFLLN